MSVALKQKKNKKPVDNYWIRKDQPDVLLL